jgi:hypothetical protein
MLVLYNLNILDNLGKQSVFNLFVEAMLEAELVSQVVSHLFLALDDNY